MTHTDGNSWGLDPGLRPPSIVSSQKKPQKQISLTASYCMACTWLALPPKLPSSVLTPLPPVSPSSSLDSLPSSFKLWFYVIYIRSRNHKWKKKYPMCLSETGLINLMIITGYIHFLVNDITLILWMEKTSIVGCWRWLSELKRTLCIRMRAWVQLSSTHVKSQEWSHPTVTQHMANSRFGERPCTKGIS